MTTTVIKAGGNVIWPRGSAKIDDTFVRSLGPLITHFLSSDSDRVVLIPGGAGGHYFIDWARSSGCEEAELNEIGSALININAKILSRLFATGTTNPFSTCPILPASFGEAKLHIQNFQLVVSGLSLVGTVSSDSLAALMAEGLKAQLLLIKNSFPYSSAADAFFDRATDSISLPKLRKYIQTHHETFRAGHQPSIDHVALSIIARSRMRASILLKNDLLSWRAGETLRTISVQ